MTIFGQNLTFSPTAYVQNSQYTSSCALIHTAHSERYAVPEIECTAEIQ